ncbi:MAG: type I-MYXAN CRISPR-associated Cas8a1/Cmx1 [Pirellulaceae bacterium]
MSFELFAPGMTPLHRAGLGGLAATLLAMTRRRKLGLISQDDLPGDWSSGEPWTIKPDRLVLHFREPEGAADYLRKLFAFAFSIKDKLIDLPGIYRDELNRAVRAELQLGLTLTFLQFGPHRKLEPETKLTFDVTGDGTAEIAVGIRACHGYLHQDAVERLKLFDKKGRLNWKATETPSAFNPGAVVRHNAFGTSTRIEELPPAGIAACFAIVGALSLAVNRGVGVLLIPEVDDLERFARSRPRMTPTTLRECRISAASDAAMQAEVRLRARGQMQRHGLTGIYTMQLRPTQWNEKQKTRVATLHIPCCTDPTLERFNLALRHLPPRIYSYAEPVTGGRGRRSDTPQFVWRWKDSLVRPLVADNLATGRRWYDGFADLMTGQDGSHVPIHQRISFEAEGLYAMLSEKQGGMTEEEERNLIGAIHRAVYMQRGKIYADTMGKRPEAGGAKPSQACFNRWSRLMERLRLGLINSKTAEQTRRLLQDDIFGRAGTIPELKDHEKLRQVHRLIFHDDWRRLRDLTMLAVVSYKAPADRAPIPGEDDTEIENDS